ADAYLVVSKNNQTILDVIAFDFAIVEPILSIYAYYDYTRTSKAYGQRRIQGSITINATKPGYLIELINNGKAPVIPDTNVSSAKIQEIANQAAIYNETIRESGNTVATEIWGDAPWAEGGVAQNLRPAMGTLNKVGPINSSGTDLILVYILGDTRRYYRLIDVDLSILKHEFDLSGKPVLEMYQFEATDIDMNLTMHGITKTEQSVVDETAEEADKTNEEIPEASTEEAVAGAKLVNTDITKPIDLNAVPQDQRETVAKQRMRYI
ncbi:unnamed protein product, partial [marine sediment metagenome]